MVAVLGSSTNTLITRLNLLAIPYLSDVTVRTSILTWFSDQYRFSQLNVEILVLLILLVIHNTHFDIAPAMTQTPGNINIKFITSLKSWQWLWYFLRIQYSGPSLSGHSLQWPPSLIWPQIYAIAARSPSHQRPPLYCGHNFLANMVALFQGVYSTCTQHVRLKWGIS